MVKEFDCLKATLEEVSVVRSQFRIPVDSGNLKIAGFAGWFDVHFKVMVYHFQHSYRLLFSSSNVNLLLTKYYRLFFSSSNVNLLLTTYYRLSFLKYLILKQAPHLEINEAMYHEYFKLQVT